MEMETTGVIEYIGLLALTWLVVEGASSIHYVKKVFGIANESQPKNLFTMVLRELFNCCLCFGFWVGVFYYISHGEDRIGIGFLIWHGTSSWFLMGCLVSIGSELFARIIKLIFGRI